MGRGDVTDAQWTFLEPLLPVMKKPGRPPKWTKRQLVDGMRWRTRAGVPWRDVPERYGAWQTVYGPFRRWQRDGTWKRILADLQADADAKGLIDWDVSVDSSLARAHQHAAAARKRGGRRRSPRAASRPSRPITGSDARKSVRAYEDSLGLTLFEAAFCFRCHEVRMHGTAVPPSLATQFFDADTPPAQALLALFRAAAP
ncbi:IS5 family transposase [Streptomyces nigrescens]